MPALRIPIAALLIALAAAAQAQTVLVPSGDSAVTQPGGTEGRAARRNIREAIRNGDVVGVPPGTRPAAVERRPPRNPARPARGE